MQGEEINIPKTPIMRAFCVHYATFRNGTKAAIKAGYSERTASQKAYELLQREDVKAYVAHLEKERLAEAEISAIDVLLELKKVAFSNIGDFLSFDEEKYIEEPNPKFDPEKEEDPVLNPKTIRSHVGGLRIKDFSELTDDQLAAVAEVSELAGIYGKSRKFKVHNKLDALQQIRAMQGMDQPKKSEVKVDAGSALQNTVYSIRKRKKDA